MTSEISKSHPQKSLIKSLQVPGKASLLGIVQYRGKPTLHFNSRARREVPGLVLFTHHSRWEEGPAFLPSSLTVHAQGALPPADHQYND